MKLIASIALPLMVGFSASFFTRPEIETWYRTLNKPTWNPPDWLFAPVWTMLYILMGIAVYLVWRKEAKPGLKRPAILLWLGQLIFNFFWSFLFFNQHDIRSALIEIVVLWIFIFMTILVFARIHKTAAWLMVPYISWVSFAGLLNYAIYKLNG